MEKLIYSLASHHYFYTDFSQRFPYRIRLANIFENICFQNNASNYKMSSMRNYVRNILSHCQLFDILQEYQKSCFCASLKVLLRNLIIPQLLLTCAAILFSEESFLHFSTWRKLPILLSFSLFTDFVFVSSAVNKRYLTSCKLYHYTSNHTEILLKISLESTLLLFFSFLLHRKSVLDANLLWSS